MIFQRKMVISHDFTIILGVREKYFFAYPPPNKKTIAYPVREILASPKIRTPHSRGPAMKIHYVSMKNDDFS